MIGAIRNLFTSSQVKVTTLSNGHKQVDLSSIDPEDVEDVGKMLKGKQAPPHYRQNPVRILFVDDYCQFCRMWKKIVPRINQKLEYWAEPINIINVSREEYATELDYKQTNLTPELFLDGIVVEGITSEAYAEAFLRKYFEDEMLVES